MINDDPINNEIKIKAQSNLDRLDVFVINYLRLIKIELSRSYIQKKISESKILVNNKKTKPKYIVQVDDIITILPLKNKPNTILPEEIPLSIIFEDSNIIVINKSTGMSVHPGSGINSGTLVNSLLFYYKNNLSTISDENRPGIVHRLDKDTSGCMVIAKNNISHKSLTKQFSNRITKKKYIAIVNGIPFKGSGKITNFIGRHSIKRKKMTSNLPIKFNLDSNEIDESNYGKKAITRFRIIKKLESINCSSIMCNILTGRTHQIRVHMKESLNCPILGDVIYGNNNKKKSPSFNKFGVNRLMLHSWKLSFLHPVTKKEMKFEAPIPKEFHNFI